LPFWSSTDNWWRTPSLEDQKLFFYTRYGL
jgi:hypothetical protein